MNQPPQRQVGDHEARWNAYLLTPGSVVLRNRVGATTIEDLRSAENDLLESRLAELRSRPTLIACTITCSRTCTSGLANFAPSG